MSASGDRRGRSPGSRPGRSVAGLLGALGALGVLVGTDPADAAGAADPPAPCLTRARVEPSQVHAGEPVSYRVEILRRPEVVRVEWLEVPRFPGFRAEWLPGRTGQDPVQRDGVRYAVTTERRVLFAARAGPHRIPSASLECHLDGDRRTVAPVEGARIEVRALPEAGRPPGAPPLVGPVRVVTRVEPDRVALGGTARLWVLVRGPGNVWEVEAPFGDSLPGADLFAEPPTLDVDAGLGLRLTRTFRYRIVPRRAGTLRIPAVEVAWFDPERESWEASRGPARTLRVDPAPPPEASARILPAPDAGAGASPSADADGDAPSRIPALLAGAAGLLAAGGAGLLAGRRWRRRRAARRELEKTLARVRAARARGDPAASPGAQRQALRRALERAWPGSRSLTAEELRQRAAPDSPLAQAAALLADLDHTLFRSEGEREGGRS